MYLSMTAVAAVLALAVPATAQDKLVTFDVVFEKAVLLPGETQTITVLARIEPGIGEKVVVTTPPFDGKTGTVAGLAFAPFWLVNGGNGEHGAFSNPHTLEPWIDEGHNGVPDGLGNVLGIRASQWVFPWGDKIYKKQDPAVLWSADWTPDEGFAGEVSFTTGLTPGLRARVWVEGLFQFWWPDKWPTAHEAGSFVVIPAPAGALALVMAGAAVRRRR